MIINPLSSLQSTLFQPLSNTTAAGSTNSVSPAAALQDSTSDISPMAQFLSNLQQMQQQNPDQFKQITANISAKLQQAATNAQSQGNSAWANQLASQFQNASTTGQMPTIQSLQQAGMSGHHHHGGHHHSTQASQTDLSSLFQTQNTNTNSQDLASIFTSALQ